MRRFSWFVFFLAIGLAVPANAEKTTWVDLNALSGCNAAAINSAIDCEVRRTGSASGNIYGVVGYNVLTLEIFYDNSAGTGIQFNIEVCHEGMDPDSCTDATDWHLVQAGSISSGTETLSDLLVLKTIGSDYYFTYSIAINYKRLRIANIVATGSPDASDKVTIWARLGYVPAI